MRSDKQGQRAQHASTRCFSGTIGSLGPNGERPDLPPSGLRAESGSGPVGEDAACTATDVVGDLRTWFRTWPGSRRRWVLPEVAGTGGILVLAGAQGLVRA